MWLTRNRLLATLLLAEACGSAEEPPRPDDTGPATPTVPTSAPVEPIGGNVLLVLVDDLGVDKVGAYGVNAAAPPTPTIDALAADGVLFRNAWANPSCSPARASLLTGRYPRRTGIGRWILPWEDAARLDPDEVLIPEVLALAGYADSGVGKWHLDGFLDNPDVAMDPLTAGFTWYGGTLGNPDNSVVTSDGIPKGYFFWEEATNGELSFESGYLTSATTDDALARVRAMPEPWFLYVSYNAPHAPLHVPPDHLHPYTLDPLTATALERFDAMVVALDTELGRLLDTLPPDVRARTTVILLSDNGTADHAILPPQDVDRGKGSLYEGGINVPFIVSGPAVAEPGTESLALVSIVDVLPTVAEIAGVALDEVIDPRTGEPVRLDGVSFLGQLQDPTSLPSRSRNYASKHFPNGGLPFAWASDALRDDRFKVVHDPLLDLWWFFEYAGPFDEGPELLASGEPLTDEQQEAFEALSAELLAQVDELSFGP